MELLTNLTLIACLCSALAVTCATIVIVDFITEASNRYKERYIEETSVQYDDILLQMPPEKIFYLSLAFAGLGAFLGIAFAAFTGTLSAAKIFLFGTVGLIIAFPAPRFYLRFLKNQRLANFNEQLEDALLSISGSLKAGFSLPQALDEIAKANRHPISFEFNLLTQELRLGVSFDEAFTKMSRRVGSKDFELVAIAVITARGLNVAKTEQYIDRLVETRKCAARPARSFLLRDVRVFLNTVNHNQIGRASCRERV